MDSLFCLWNYLFIMLFFGCCEAILKGQCFLLVWRLCFFFWNGESRFWLKFLVHVNLISTLKLWWLVFGRC